MSRSFGDGIASMVGVTWEPEILEFTIDSDSKFLVIASDGIWEYINNKDVYIFINYTTLIFYFLL